MSLQVVNGEVQVDVRDNGIGIHPDDQHRIFERFYRGEDPLVLASAGTGLGWRSREDWWVCIMVESGLRAAECVVREARSRLRCLYKG